MRVLLSLVLVTLSVGVLNAQLPTPLIAFVEDGNLLLWQDGVRRVLVETGDVGRVWLNPEGTRVAFIRHDEWVYGDEPTPDPTWNYPIYRSTSLWAADVDGANRQKVVDLDDYRTTFGDGTPFRDGTSIYIAHLTWIPGTTIVAFNTFIDHEIVSGYARPFANFYTVDTKTGDVFLEYVTHEDGGFSLAPDNRTVAITTEHRIDVINLAGREVLPDALTYEPSAATPSQPFYPPIFWAQDSQSFLTVDLKSRISWTEGEDYPEVDLVKVALDGTVEVLRTGREPELNVNSFRFAEDGSAAYFSTGFADTCSFETIELEVDIVLAPTADTLIPCGTSFITFSPDSTTYRLEPDGAQATLYQLDSDSPLGQQGERIQVLNGPVQGFRFIDDRRFAYRILLFTSDQAYGGWSLHYGEIGGEVQKLAELPLTSPTAAYSITIPN